MFGYCCLFCWPSLFGSLLFFFSCVFVSCSFLGGGYKYCLGSFYTFLEAPTLFLLHLVVFSFGPAFLTSGFLPIISWRGILCELNFCHWTSLKILCNKIRTYSFCNITKRNLMTLYKNTKSLYIHKKGIYYCLFHIGVDMRPLISLIWQTWYPVNIVLNFLFFPPFLDFLKFFKFYFYVEANRLKWVTNRVLVEFAQAFGVFTSDCGFKSPWCGKKNKIDRDWHLTISKQQPSRLQDWRAFKYLIKCADRLITWVMGKALSLLSMARIVGWRLCHWAQLSCFIYHCVFDLLALFSCPSTVLSMFLHSLSTHFWC